jgi:hypothetical protein
LGNRGRRSCNQKKFWEIEEEEFWFHFGYHEHSCTKKTEEQHHSIFN